MAKAKTKVGTAAKLRKKILQTLTNWSLKGTLARSATIYIIGGIVLVVSGWPAWILVPGLVIVFFDVALYEFFYFAVVRAGGHRLAIDKTFLFGTELLLAIICAIDAIGYMSFQGGPTAAETASQAEQLFTTLIATWVFGIIPARLFISLVIRARA
jgi:hypothetical protein